MKRARKPITESSIAVIAVAKESVALVGMSQPITPRDLTMLGMAREYSGALWPERYKPDVVNIEDNGRDFLAEKTQYDVVLLFSIFHSHPRFFEMARQTPKMCKQVSPLHSEEAWRCRLETSGARLIVVVEGLPYSLNGWQLSELRGYEIVKRDHLVTVYSKKGS